MNQSGVKVGPDERSRSTEPVTCPRVVRTVLLLLEEDATALVDEEETALVEATTSLDADSSLRKTRPEEEERDQMGRSSV